MKAPAVAVARVSAQLVSILLLAACSGGGEAAECEPRIESVRDCVAASVRAVEPDTRLPSPTSADVRLYVDRSGSMNGYLDAQNADSGRVIRTGVANLRTTLDRLLAVGGEGTTLYGFGERITSFPALSHGEALKRLFSQAFYDESDTRTEEVLALVRADSARRAVHLIVTDGRRGSGESAIAQYQQIGQVASWWTVEGGIFAMAASMAPFQEVRDDRAGCWQSEASADGRCPLYIFAFIPAPAAERTLSVLDQVADRLYAYPPPADDRIRIGYTSDSTEGPGFVEVVEDEPFVLGLRAGGAQNEPASAAVTLTFHADASAARFAFDDSLALRVDRAGLRRQAPAWSAAAEQDRVEPGMPRTGDRSTLLLPLTIRTYGGLSPTLYRVEISSLGIPRWIGEYEAVQQRDSLRTYGLASLFTQLQPRSAVIAGTFVVVY